MEAKKPIDTLRRWYPHIILLVLVIVSNSIRVAIYPSSSLSVSMLDTGSYLNTAKIPLNSWDFFTANRSLTVPLVYKLFEMPGGYAATNVSEPAVQGNVGKLGEQPGFGGVISFQIALSMLGWSLLACAFYLRLRNRLVGLLGSALILAFGFSPQMAEWDSVAISESLSFSLFAILMSLSLVILPWLDDHRKGRSWVKILVIALWGVVGFFWIFTRDTNAYLMALIASLLLLLFVVRFFNRKQGQPVMFSLFLLSLLLFGFHQVTFRSSDRWFKPLMNNLTRNVFPYSTRVQFFAERGMPVYEELLSVRGSLEYNRLMEHEDFIDWARKDGLSAYTSFLIHTPRWALIKFSDSIDFMFSENLQPYFKDRRSPDWMMVLGDMLHSKSGVAVMVSMLLASTLWIFGLKSGDDYDRYWGWFALWLFGSSLALMFVGFHGEVRSVLRHAMVGVVPLRLSLWLFIPVLLDHLFVESRLKSVNTSQKPSTL